MLPISRRHLSITLNVIVTVISFCVFSSQAQYLSHKVNGDQLTVVGTHQKFTLTPYNSSAFEVLYQNEHHYQLPSYAIAQSAEISSAELITTTDTLVFQTGDLIAVIDKSTLNVSYFFNDKPLIKEQSFSNSSAGLSFEFELNATEQLLGGGQRVLGMNRRGHKFPLYNKAHYGYTTESSQMYYGLPAIMSTEKYILVFDNSATGEMDLGSTSPNTLAVNTVSGRSSYLVVADDSYPNLINQYVNLTGKQPMPPRWALGNFASRFGYRSQQEVLDTAAKFRQDDIPLDAIVLDLYWFGKDIKGHMGNLDWDKSAFPKPEQMINQLTEQDVNTVVITEPFVLSSSNKWQQASDAQALAQNSESNPYQFDFYFGNTGLVDVFNSKGTDWFSKPYSQLAAQGVTGWWGDLGKPEVQPDDILHTLENGQQVRGDAIHNVYGHKWAEMVYNHSLQLSPNKRPMIMMRSGFAGSQRFGMIPWTGDVSRSWDGLKPQVELSLQMGLFGLAYTHSDLGGFAGGEKFDAHMYTRWLQYGAFQPVYRPHAQDNIAPEPVIHDELTKSIVRDYIKLRYQLLPYNYTLAYQNSLTGMPLMRPLFFANESDPTLIAEKNSYLWGDAFLVTPVTSPNVDTVEVNIPDGVWFNFWNDGKVIGKGKTQYPVDLLTIPVLVKAGSFIPMAEPIPNTKAYDASKLTLHYYNDDSVTQSTGQLYEDDGTSLNSLEQQHYQLLTFNGNNNDKAFVVDFSQSGQGYHQAPTSKEVQFVIHNWQVAPKTINIAGKTVYQVSRKQAFDLAAQGAYWDDKNHTLMVKFNLASAKQTLIISK